MDTEQLRSYAAEGWIWGYPLVANYRALYAQAVDVSNPAYAGGFGHFRHETRTREPEGPAVMSRAWLDLRAEPWVLSVPSVDRAYVLPVHDLDLCYAGFVGTPVTGPGPGTFLVAGPAFQDDTPPGFHGTIQCATELVGLVGRVYPAGPDDMGAVREVQAGFDLRPLHSYTGETPPPVPPSPAWPAWHQDVLTSPGFFRLLDFLLDFFPTREDEFGVRSDLAALGVTGAGTFDPDTTDPELHKALKDGITDGRARVAQVAGTLGPSARLHGTRDQFGADYLARTVGALRRPYALPSELAASG